jgi:hypothetical protein
MQDTYLIARAGTILHLTRNEMTLASCNPNGEAPQDTVDDSTWLDLIPDLVINFAAYEVMATVYMQNVRVRTIC